MKSGAKMTTDLGPSVGERTQAKILDAALPLFAAHGFEGASVRRIATAAGVNVATLAYHFTDKDGLYRASLQRLYRDLAALDLDPNLLTGPDPLEAVIGVMWDFAGERRDHIRLLHRHLLDKGRHHDVSDAWIEVLMARATELLGMASPQGDPVELRLLVYGVTHLIVRLVLDDADQLRATLGSDAAPRDVVVPWLSRLVRRQLGA